MLTKKCTFYCNIALSAVCDEWILLGELQCTNQVSRMPRDILPMRSSKNPVDLTWNIIKWAFCYFCLDFPPQFHTLEIFTYSCFLLQKKHSNFVFCHFRPASPILVIFVCFLACFLPSKMIVNVIGGHAICVWTFDTLILTFDTLILGGKWRRYVFTTSCEVFNLAALGRNCLN